MRWGAPGVLYGLLLLPAAAWLLFALIRRRERAAAALADRAAWAAVYPGWEPAVRRRRAWVWLAAVALVLAALARPQWGFRWQEVRQRGLDILIVMDTSRSMMAEDFKPSRLQQAKWAVRDFVRNLKGDRVGLVAFAGSSFLQCPLTADYAAFLMTLDDVYAGIIPRGGTAITQALETALKSFEKRPDADRAIILVTDGEDHEGDPAGLADRLKAEGIRVYAVGVGTREGELIPDREKPGAAFFKDHQGHVVKTALQEEALERLALATGGAYVRAVPGDAGMERVFRDALAPLKRGEGESRMMKAYEDRYGWLLGAAATLLALECLVGFRRGREAAA